jgi:hypothetical protein
METKVDFKVLDCIEKIYNLSKDSHLREPFFKSIKQELALLSPYLKLNEIETVLFANAFAMWFETSSFATIFEYFGLNNFQVLKYRESIEVLYSSNLLLNRGNRRKQISAFELSQNIINAISKNEVIKFQYLEEIIGDKHLVDHLEEFNGMKEKLDSKSISNDDFKEYISTLCDENIDMPIFREIKNYQLDTFETYFFLDTIWDAIICGDNDFNTNINSTVNDYFSQKSQSLQQMKKIINKETKLSKLNLIEISNQNFMNKPHAKLSKKVTDFLCDNQ